MVERASLVEVKSTLQHKELNNLEKLIPPYPFLLVFIHMQTLKKSFDQTFLLENFFTAQKHPLLFASVIISL